MAYSITSRQSLLDLTPLRTEFLRIKQSQAGSVQIPMVLCATKSDLESQREVSREEGRRIADEWQVPFIETSCIGYNVREVFVEVVREIKKTMKGEKRENCRLQ